MSDVSVGVWVQDPHEVYDKYEPAKSSTKDAAKESCPEGAGLVSVHGP
jgi:hypothetical protein